jgi:hypothetical protein
MRSFVIEIPQKELINCTDELVNAFYATRMFIAALRTAFRPSESLATSINCKPIPLCYRFQYAHRSVVHASRGVPKNIK